MIFTKRFELKRLKIRDVSDKYLSWFNDPEVKKYISEKPPTLSELKNYVKKKSKCGNVLFLGIFSLQGEHIGNIKYEPIDKIKGCATMGILIGDKNWRNKGVSKEVIIESARWLYLKQNIKKITLGVDKNHEIAIRAYRGIGFIEEININNSKNNNKYLKMILDISIE